MAGRIAIGRGRGPRDRLRRGGPPPGAGCSDALRARRCMLDGSGRPGASTLDRPGAGRRIDGHSWYAGVRAAGPDGFDCLSAVRRAAPAGDRVSESRGSLLAVTELASPRARRLTVDGQRPASRLERPAPLPVQTVRLPPGLQRLQAQSTASSCPYTDRAGRGRQPNRVFWHVSKVELNPKGIDKAFR